MENCHRNSENIIAIAPLLLPAAGETRCIGCALNMAS